jgi:hypothetical protein
MRSSRLVRGACAGLLILVVAEPARGQTAAANSLSAEPEEEQLAEKVQDPTAILTQLKFQDLYTPTNFRTTAQTNTFQLQAVLPISSFSLLPVEQIVRPTLKVDTIATGPGSSTITELGDIELFDLFVSRWPDPERWGLGWGVGPTFVFPTASDRRVGKRAWQAGPAAAVVFRGVPHLLLSFLFQNPISFAYSSPTAKPQSAMLFQPGISYRFASGWYLKSSDSTWTVNWRHNTSTTIPISLGFGRVWKFAGPELDTWVSGEWMAYRQFADITPMYTVRFGLSFLFPHFEL